MNCYENHFTNEGTERFNNLLKGMQLATGRTRTDVQPISLTMVLVLLTVIPSASPGEHTSNRGGGEHKHGSFSTVICS